MFGGKAVVSAADSMAGSPAEAVPVGGGLAALSLLAIPPGFGLYRQPALELTPAGKFPVTLIGSAPKGDEDAFNAAVASTDPESPVKKAEARMFFDHQYDVCAPAAGDGNIDLALLGPVKVKLTIEMVDRGLAMKDTGPHEG